MTFTVDVKEWAAQAGLDLIEAKRAAALQVFSSVIMATPVGNASQWKNPKSAPPGYVGGRLRGNWQASLDTPETGMLDTTDKNGSLTIQAVDAVVSGATGDSPIFLTNNLPYAHRIEYGGHSKQAPNGMVRVNILAWNRAVEEAAR
tara:strand:+ start:1267 stop:1704 length:438 start_codon:yes stop_codon:yes gene_type:complete